MPSFGKKGLQQAHPAVLRHRPARLRAYLPQVPQRREVLRGPGADHGRGYHRQNRRPHHPGNPPAATAPPCRARTEIIETEEALKALLERIGMLGWYAKVMTEPGFREISADRAKVDALFHQLARQRLDRGSSSPNAPGRHGHQVLRHRRQRRLPRRAGGHEDLRRPDLHRLRRHRRAARRSAHHDQRRQQHPDPLEDAAAR